MNIRLILLILLILFNHSLFSTEVEDPKIIHVFVALCDNVNQGIVPVPDRIGNGQDPYHNLYWGAGYGVKNFFDKKSTNWTLIKTFKNPTTKILERVVFKNTASNTYLVADAYDGAEIKQSIINFLHATSGQFKDTIILDNTQLLIGGHSDLIAYIGHNGLMDFEIKEKFKVNRTKVRDVIILACYSKHYFQRYLKRFNTNPLVWTNGLMAPEAYTLKWAIDGWLKGEDNEQVATRARKAYNHYQKCGIRGATNLLSTGFDKED